MCWINAEKVAERMPIITEHDVNVCWIVVGQDQEIPETQYVLGNPGGTRVLGFTSKIEANKVARALATHNTITTVEKLIDLKNTSPISCSILDLADTDTKH